MKSIRARLTLWLLSGLTLLLAVAGAGVYLSTQDRLLSALDAELALDARLVRFAARGSEETEPTTSRKGGARRLQDRMPDYDEPTGTAFFQQWDGDGTVLDRSVSLGELELGRPEAAPVSPVFGTERLADGRVLRTMTFRSVGGGKGKGKGKGGRASGSNVTVLAKDSQRVGETLSSLFWALVIMGGIAVAGIILIVRLALKAGLAPLQTLADQTTQIDSSTLDARFDHRSAPSELQPVYHHLNELIRRLESSFDRERGFSADLAHEMRTPLAELKMLHEVALKWPDQAGTEFLSESLDVLDQLSGTIETLLHLARLDSGEAAPALQSVDLPPLVQEIRESLAEAAAAKSLDFEVTVSDDSCGLETDPTLFRHLLTNLVSNAIEYTPTGGSIQIQIQPESIEIANPTEDLLEADLPHLFDRHWRKDASRNSREHAGLGLSISRSIAEALGLSLAPRLEGTALRFRIAPNSNS